MWNLRYTGGFSVYPTLCLYRVIKDRVVLTLYGLGISSN